MRARSALFDVFGGHLRGRGGSASIAALVKLLEPLGFGAPAIRTAVSRMVRQGWLAPVRLAEGPGYALTARAERRLDEAAARIYRTARSTWDHRWHVVVLEELPSRGTRDRLASSLRLLGYGPLGPATWVAPRPSAELAEVLAAEEVAARTFHGPHDGADADLAARAWDLTGLGEQYREFVDTWAPLLSAVDDRDPAESFAAAQRLLHAWRGFLFHDPGLPPELLPAAWPGDRAARFFDEQTARLAPAVGEFLDDCLNRGGKHKSTA
ncbi:PaaX family transcriptional regulator C-terminal domain-containing protein [Actinokineospora auranticolor]|uniref:Phenylacetic acid degradation operon negative regulatory protein n=1 Tax=Actinokineospora auranticolor TaxID=155976 RepID=A0A2S6GY91_9PSEU|nr:PaaX family transcriptional regulator C-terminal domain-containing protein [Actinokineospora auranticolor]PPK70146.1 phenylacetic acid degradation operon negative regulatory protein [Actinokineospora auranticolor]